MRKKRQNLLRREKLLSLLHENKDKKLTVIVQPPGYGKTTLLLQFLDELDEPYVFYSPYKKYENLISFVNFFIQGMKKFFPNIGRTLSQVTKESQDVEIIAGTMTNEFITEVKRDTFIVIDDYHMIENEQLNSFLNLLLTYSPPHIHFIISSRSKIPFPYIKWKVKGRVFELTVLEDFRFTLEETKELFTNVFKLSLSEEELKKIYSYFQGWVTGFQVFSYLCGKKGKKVPLFKLEALKDIFLYFKEEIFYSQPSTIREFLLQTSLLEKITPKVCDKIFNRKDSEEILTYLIETNLFTFCIDPEKEIYEYHPLFKEFLDKLRKNIMKEEEEKKQLTFIGNYYLKQNNYLQAMEYFLRAEKVEKVVKILENHGIEMIREGNLDLVSKYLYKIPSQMVLTNGELLFLKAECEIWHMNWEEAEKCYQRAKKIFEKENKMKRVCECLIGRARIAVYTHKIDSSIRIAQNTLKKIKKYKLYSLQGFCIRVLGVGLLEKGKYEECISYLQKGIKLSKMIKNEREETALLNNLANCYVHIGKSDLAIEIFLKLIKEYSLNLFFCRIIYINIGWLYLLQGKEKLFLDYSNKAFSLCRRFKDKIGLSYLLAHFGWYYYYFFSNFNVARAYWENAKRMSGRRKLKDIENLITEGIVLSYLEENDVESALQYFSQIKNNPSLCGEIKFTQGKLKEAEEYFTKSIQQEKYSTSNLVRGYIGLAKVNYLLKNEEKTKNYLQKGLKIAEKSKKDLLLVKHSRIGEELVKWGIKNKIRKEYLKKIHQKIKEKYDLRIKLFSNFQVEVKGKTQQINFERIKVFILFLFFLLNRKKTWSKESIIEQLFPYKSWSSASRLFDVRLSLLKKSWKGKIGEKIIEKKEGSYFFNPKLKVWVDCEEFDERIKKGKRWEREDENVSLTLYEEAIDLYEGDFLALYKDEWVEEMQTYYRRKYINVLETVCRLYEKKQKYNQLIEYSQKLIETNKWKEDGWKWLIKGLLKIGEKEKAEQYYQKMKKLFEKEEIPLSGEIMKLISPNPGN